jgi:GT2 family glycosyltransferase
MKHNSNPQVTIVLLNFNNFELTAACLRSLSALEQEKFETLVVDNASSNDEAARLTQEFSAVTVLPQKTNLGFAGGCNIGMRHALAAGSEFVLLLNNDTYVAPDFLAEMLNCIQLDRKIGAVSPKIFFAAKPDRLWFAGADFNPLTGRVVTHGYKHSDEPEFNFPRDITQATGCAMLIRSSALSEVGLLDENFWAYVEDLDLSMRLHAHGYRIVYAPKARVWHWDGATVVKSAGSGSQALRQYLSTRNMLFLARKHLYWWQMPSFLLGFLFLHVGFYSGLRIWRRDFRAFAAVYKGIGHGLWRAVKR